MKRLFALCVVSLSFSLYALNIEEKIGDAQEQIAHQKSKAEHINGVLKKIATDIERRRKKLNEVTQSIERSKKKIQALQMRTSVKKSELNKIAKIYKKLTKDEKVISKQFVEQIAKDISIRITTGEDMEQNETSGVVQDLSVDEMIKREILNTYTDLLKRSIQKKKSKYIKISKNMELMNRQIGQLSNRLKKLKAEKQMLIELKETQKGMLQSLEQKKRSYIAKLNQIQKEQSALSRTLQKLHIVKKQQTAKEIKLSGGKINVRQIGNSYQRAKLTRYRGRKTMAPLSSYTVVQRFGSTIDPIYKIKIFNDSVILRSRKKNAKVFNVLNGEVIYADHSPILGNVVIVKHANGLHTIYSHLSKIAPMIRKGKRLKKGYAIGRVERDLNFSVTKNERQINPMQLIR